MKYILICLSIFKTFLVYGQIDSTVFDRNFNFKNGIYSTYAEVLSNNPKYPGYKIDHNAQFYYSKIQFYYFDRDLNKQPFNDSVFAIAEEGILFVKYKNQLFKLMNKGAISTFIVEKTRNQYPGYMEEVQKVFFYDLKTGIIDKLTPNNAENFLMRDNELYTTFSDLNMIQKNKMIYSYILKYNTRNPIYIKSENDTFINPTEDN
jgi:hypothetical protein